MPTKIIGTAPYQVPRNADLGTMAFQDVTSFKGPAFYAWMNGNQIISNATQTKAAFNTEKFDTNSCYDPTTYRFTPNMPGYYFINAIALFGAQTNVASVNIYKNGARWVSGDVKMNGSTSDNITCSSLLYLNGSTDYVEVYLYQASGGNLTIYGTLDNLSEFSGFMVRGA